VVAHYNSLLRQAFLLLPKYQGFPDIEFILNASLLMCETHADLLDTLQKILRLP